MTVQEIAAAVATGAWLSRELDDDGVELWHVVRSLRDQLPTITDQRLQLLAEGVLRGLLKTDAVLGELNQANEFVAWGPDRGVEYVMARWRELGRDPNIGDIAWLVRQRRVAG